jgi:hypothetical protein
VSNSAAFAALKNDGSISAWGDSLYGGGTDAPTGTGFTQLFSNNGAFTALKADGSITAWGNSDFGGSGAPAGTGFVTIQSSQTSDPVFTGVPASGVLQGGLSGKAYFANLGAQGVGARYELTTGSLPSGLTLDPVTGVLSGTPTASGTFVFSMAASSPAGTTARNLSLAVGSAPIFTSATSATFTAGTAVSFTVAATGVTSGYSFTGTLPAGLKLNLTSGKISGTPAAGSGGVANIVITATNAFGSSTQALALTVNESPVFTNNISTNFTLGSAGTFQFTANAYPAPTFAAIGTLPDGVTLSSNGILSGTPSGASGIYRFLMSVGNGVGSNKTQTFSLMVNEAPVFFTDASTVFVGGQLGSFPVTAYGFPSKTYALASGSNPLPAGLSFDPNALNSGKHSGLIIGTPTAPNGSYTVTVRATNSAGFTDQTVTIDIKGGTVSSFTPANARGGSVVTLSGQQFTGATQVSFGGIQLHGGLRY